MESRLTSDKDDALAKLQSQPEQQASEALEKALSDKSSEASTSISQLKSAYEDQMEALRAEHDGVVQTLREEMQHQMQMASDDKAKTIDMERSSAEARLSEAKVAFELQAAKERDVAIADLKEALQSSFEERLQVTKDTYQQEKVKLLFDQKAKVEKAMKQQEKAALKQQKQELKDDFKNQLSASLSEQEAALTEKATKAMEGFYNKYKCGKRKRLIDLKDEGTLIS